MGTLEVGRKYPLEVVMNWLTVVKKEVIFKHLSSSCLSVRRQLFARLARLARH